MNVIFIITSIIILVYMMYPLWLKLISYLVKRNDSPVHKIDGVTLILLSYNGRPYLEDKIRMLMQELRDFDRHEMIIVDDCSIDGSQEILNRFRDEKGVRIILKGEHKGIPHSMNLGVLQAKYDYLVFSDQRQVSSTDILRKLVEPLGNEDIGAVSACISHVDKAGCSSFIRRYENFLKAGESRAGSLMGVYGPLYALKKSCYSPIPESIILDDLYLSLKVMETKKISILAECRIYDEHICSLHDYRRIKRYLTGFLQIIADRRLLARLPGIQLTMLLWHKYLRLLIPVLFALCYFSTGVLCLKHPLYLISFSFLTTLGILSLTPAIYRLKNIIIHFVRINVLYVIAMAQVLLKVEH